MMLKQQLRCLFLIVILLNAGGLVRAQDDLPQVDGYVRGHSTEVLFPMAVRFRATFSQSVDLLREVKLRIEPVGEAAIDVVLDLEEDVLNGSELFTEYDYVWELPSDIQLPLFSRGNVVFEWQAVDTVGRTARVRDALDFRDDRVNWQVDEDPAGNINLFVAADGPDPQLIRQGAQFAYDLVTTNAGRSEPVNVIVYDPAIDLSVCQVVQDEDTNVERLVTVSQSDGLAVTCDPSRAATIFANSDFIVLQATGTSLSAAQNVLIDWVVRHFYEPFWRDDSVPVWFQSGLVNFYQPQNKSRLLLPVQTAARTDRLLTLAAMNMERSDDLWTAQSYAMVLYIADLIGVPALFDLAVADSFTSAYEQATGQALAALLPNLRRWIFTDSATSAYGYTPYQPETATPTPSRTLTTFPPTATHTPTASSTPTFTPSVTGELSPTPSLTPTPTRTTTPLPPSVTPRPASSLFTPTPIPTLTVLDNPVSRLGIVTVLLIILAILGLIYVLLGRRNND